MSPSDDECDDEMSPTDWDFNERQLLDVELDVRGVLVDNPWWTPMGVSARIAHLLYALALKLMDLSALFDVPKTYEHVDEDYFEDEDFV